MNNTNNSTEARIENCNIRIAKLKSELKACTAPAQRCIIKTRLEVAESTLSRLLDNRDNMIMANKIGALINPLVIGKSITITPQKLVTAETLKSWGNILVKKEVVFGDTVYSELDKATVEGLNAKDFLHTVRHCFTVEKKSNGSFVVTRKSYRKAKEAGFATPDDLKLDFWGMI